MVTDTTVRFRPDQNESEDHKAAKIKLWDICLSRGMFAVTEEPVKTEYKTYWCDVFASFKFFGSEIKLDLEVEDHDHSRHDYEDAHNKQKELARYFYKTIWFKSKDILKAEEQHLIDKIFYEMMDGHETDPRFNI